jgi:hypothetical protein
MPLGFTDEQEWALLIARALEQIAEGVEKLARLPGGDDRPRYPELRDVAMNVEAAARIMNEGVAAGSLSRGQIAAIGDHFERAGRDLGEGGKRRA